MCNAIRNKLFAITAGASWGIYNAGILGRYSPHNNPVKSIPATSIVHRLLIWPCLLALPAMAAELWVSPAGNDAGPGTQTHPFITVERAA